MRERNKANGSFWRSTTQRMLAVVGVAAVTAALLQAAPSSASHDGEPSVFDCAGDPPGMLQTVNGSSTAGNYTMFKKLNVDSGDYESAGTSNLVWSDLLGRNGLTLNSTATDPATGKSFATLNDEVQPVLVQFDMDGHVRFVGRLPGTASWAAIINADGDCVHNVTIEQGLGVVPDVSSLQTFPLSTDVATLPMVGSIVETTPNDPPGDIAVIESNGVEYVVGYDHFTNRLMAYGSDLTQPPIAFTNTILPPEFGTSNDVLGAAWSFDGNAYFSRNDGGGLFVLDGDDFDPTTLTAELKPTTLLDTVSTSSNDGGMGCFTTAQLPATTTTAPPSTTTTTTTAAPATTTTAAPTTTTAPPVVESPVSEPAEPVTETPTFTG